MSGIDLIHNIKNKVEDISKLQLETKEKVQQIYEFSNTTKIRSNEVAKQSEEMAADVQNTLRQTNAIADAAKTQSDITVTLDDSFHMVDDISKNLLAISSQID